MKNKLIRISDAKIKELVFVGPPNKGVNTGRKI